MAITFDATYENGVLVPAQPLALSEHEKVRVTVVPCLERPEVALPATATPETTQPPIWERIVALTADAPAEELAKPPIDGASQHDHYLYGSPRRPE